MSLGSQIKRNRDLEVSKARLGASWTAEVLVLALALARALARAVALALALATEPSGNMNLKEDSRRGPHVQWGWAGSGLA